MVNQYPNKDMILKGSGASGGAQGGAGGAGGGKTMTRAAFDAATPAAKAEFAKKRRHRHRLIDRVTLGQPMCWSFHFCISATHSQRLDGVGALGWMACLFQNSKTPTFKRLHHEENHAVGHGAVRTGLLLGRIGGHCWR
jgi:hypothetical protein